MKKIHHLIRIFTSRERQRLILILCIVSLMALVDAIGVASIMPFMAIVSNPDILRTNELLNLFYLKIGASDYQHFIIVIGLATLIFLNFTILFRALTQYLLIRFAQMQEYFLGRRLLKYFLDQDYQWFLKQHSSDLTKEILSELNQVIHGLLIPLLLIISNVLAASAICVLLVLIDPKTAFISFAVIGLLSVLMAWAMKGILRKLGEQRTTSNRLRYSAVVEAFGGIKETKLFGLETSFVERFSSPARVYALSHARSSGVALIPRALLEIFAMGGILLITLLFVIQGNPLNSFLPTLSLYAFAGYRLLPSVQQIYTNFATFKFSLQALENLTPALIQSGASDNQSSAANLKKSTICFDESITFNKLDFTYRGSDLQALNQIDLRIRAGMKVGFVGYSGSGKTTAVDILAGLLLANNPKSFAVDGQPISQSNVCEWRKLIAYVPQDIFLLDDTIESNIAFGLTPEEYDYSKIEIASKKANLHQFIIEQLPKGYQTMVGERGVRISGGQRQRIGIARALFREPKVLILDEATSALDAATEALIANELSKLAQGITIISVAHRLSTIKNCDQIFVFSEGKIVANGTYEELLIESEVFKKLH